MNNFIKKCICICILGPTPAYGFSATYFYQLYLHNEYYSEPPGFPNRISVAPIITSLQGAGDNWKEKRFSAGLVESVRLVHDQNWIELIFGFGKENVRFSQLDSNEKEHASRAGLDDFLIDIGHNFLDESGKKQLLIHLLAGIPLHWNITEHDIHQPLWGTRTYAIGPVIELAYDFRRSEAEDLFVGAICRFLHRFPRAYDPILPPDAEYHPGNLLNLLGLIHYRYYSHNFEGGYVYTQYSSMANKYGFQIERLPSNRYHNLFIDYFYFYEPRSLGFEIGIVKTWGTPYHGVSVFGLAAWYF